MNCAACRYWTPTERMLDALGRASSKDGAAERIGECHCLPPQPFQGQAGSWRWFASTRASDWCGHFAEVPKAAPAKSAKKSVDTPAAKTDK